jgi:hypothetical protein
MYEYNITDMKHSNIPFTRKMMIFGILILCQVFPSTAQTDSLKNLAQYLYPEFSVGKIKLKTGKAITANMNYNTLTEKLTFIQNGTLLDLAKPETVDTIILQNNKFVFINDALYELVINGPVSLFIQHKSNLSSTGRPGAYGTKSQTSGPVSVTKLYSDNNTYKLKLPVEYVVTKTPINWIRTDNAMHKILTTRQFFKLFPAQEEKIKQFVKQNKLNIKDSNDLIKIVTFCNELNKQ